MPGSNPKSQAYFLVDIGENGDADSNVKVSLQDSWTEQETNVLRYSHRWSLVFLNASVLGSWSGMLPIYHFLQIYLGTDFNRPKLVLVLRKHCARVMDNRSFFLIYFKFANYIYLNK